MNNALTVSGLTKTYKDFLLNQVSFHVPGGAIVGLIGENGAGKSTTINAALGLIRKESGQVSILEKEELDNDTKEQIGVVFDAGNYPEILSPRKINHIMRKIYHTWEESRMECSSSCTKSRSISRISSRTTGSSPLVASSRISSLE